MSFRVAMSYGLRLGVLSQTVHTAEHFSLTNGCHENSPSLAAPDPAFVAPKTGYRLCVEESR